MNPFKNKLSELTHQNDEELWDIQSADTRGKVLRMTRYLSSASIPLFLIEEIKKDVIGIALEAEREGIDIEEKLGLSIKEFCDDIISNTKERTARYEQLGNVAVMILQLFAFCYTLNFLFTYSAPAQFGITVNHVIFVLLYCVPYLFNLLYLMNRFSIYNRPVLRYLPVLLLLPCSFVLFYVFNNDGSPYYLIKGNGWVILVIILCLALAATIGRNIYWNYCYKKYRH